MRYGFLIAGLVAIGLGLGVVSGKLEYQKTDTVLQVGEFKAAVKHDAAIPQWIGLLVLAVGGGLVAASVLGKR